MGIPGHLTCFLRNLYAGQEATVRTGHGRTDCLQIGKGVWAKMLLSLCLFMASLVAQLVKNPFQCGKPGFSLLVGRISWRRKWQPTPIFLSGKSHGWRSLVDYSSWGCKESDITEWLRFHFLSFCLFNLHAEYIMRNAGLDESKVGIGLSGEISITSDMQMTPPLWQKVKKN